MPRGSPVSVTVKHRLQVGAQGLLHGPFSLLSSPDQRDVAGWLGQTHGYEVFCLGQLQPAVPFRPSSVAVGVAACQPPGKVHREHLSHNHG